MADQRIEQIAHAICLTGADVVGTRRPSVLDDKPIGAHGVADVRDVAAGLEIADAEHRVAKTRFDLRNLPREARRDIALGDCRGPA